MHPNYLSIKHKGGFIMAAIWWITTIGFVLCLGFVGGTFFHFLRNSLDSEDAKRVDKIDSDK
ncbi:hypothetical protein CN481_22340 [Bacillus sp. AFS006103]|nr:hypothetical protein CN481_22340 [Bacillus sp. AFS006103]